MGYVCHSCGRHFLIQLTVPENDGLECPPFRQTDLCPQCWSPDFEEEKQEEEEEEFDTEEYR